MDRRCRHCGQALGFGAVGAFCCAGCQASAQWMAFVSQAAEPITAAHGGHPTASEPELNSATWRVENMHCASCATRIQTVLNAVEGVAHSNANPATATVSVQFDRLRADIEQVQKTLGEAGYPALPGSLVMDAPEADSTTAAAPPSSTSAHSHGLPDIDTSEINDRSVRRRAWARIFVAGMGAMQSMMFMDALYWAGDDGMGIETRDFFRWLAFLFATPVVFYSAQPFFRAAWAQLRARFLGMDVLVALSVGLAYGVSVIELLRGGRQVYFDAAVMFVFFLSVSRWLEESWRHKAHSAISRLAARAPQTATRLNGNQEEIVALSQLRIGDVLLVAPHAPVAADGVLLDDAGEFDESLLTGESLPQAKSKGSRVLGGSLNGTSQARIQVTALSSESLLAQLQRLSQRALAQKPERLQFADRVAAWFTPLVLLLTVATALVWWWVDASRAIAVALSVLAISCPCALALATPTALASAYAALAKRGVLVLQGNALETLAKVNHVLFDKTGTLTIGRLTLHDVVALQGLSAAQARVQAAALSKQASHPVTAALRDEAVPPATSLQQIPGQGVHGFIAGAEWRLGSARFCSVEDSASTPWPGPSVWLRGPNGEQACFRFDDALRETAIETVRELSAMKVGVTLVSGDRSEPVQAVARQLQLTDAHAALTPNDKLTQLNALRNAGKTVLMVGDGINDAPVLAAADVSMSFEQGASMAHQVSDLVLVSPRSDRVLDALDVSRRAQRIEKQSLWWAVGYNALAIPAAVFGFVSPWLAALGMSVSSLLVTLNALRLLRPRRSSQAGGPSSGLAIPMVENATKSQESQHQFIVANNLKETTP